MGQKLNDPVLLTIRGTLSNKDLEATRKLHNETAGSEPGKAAAIALGDLSHKVYVPAEGGEKTSDAKPGEILFMDIWRNPEGLQQFFSNKQVQEQGGQLFKEKNPTVHMPATGAFSFHLPTAMTRTDRYIGILQGKAKSVEALIAAFREGMSAGIADARKHGQVSTELYVTLGPPSTDGSADIVAVDVFHDLKGMVEVYSTPAMQEIGKLFVGRPSGSIWTQPKGIWNEW
jgi:hypothetical protein